MLRVFVVGNAGSGKTTLAGRMAERLAVTHIELDSIFHLPGWEELPADEFRAAVVERVGGEGWVVDGNYRAVWDVIGMRADTVVWLDLPRALIMRRVVRRTVRRLVTREELWNGNREPFGNLWRLDPNRSIIRWAWTQHRKYVERYEGAMADPQWAHLRFVRLRSPDEVEGFVSAVTSP